MSQIGNTEALEKYLSLESENKTLRNELNIYKIELETMRKAYSNLSDKVGTLFNWLENKDKTKTVRRRMAELFKFAYMEAPFDDLRAKWPNREAAKLFDKPSLVEAKEAKQ